MSTKHCMFYNPYSLLFCKIFALTQIAMFCWHPKITPNISFQNIIAKGNFNFLFLKSKLNHFRAKIFCLSTSFQIITLFNIPGTKYPTNILFCSRLDFKTQQQAVLLMDQFFLYLNHCFSKIFLKRPSSILKYWLKQYDKKKVSPLVWKWIRHILSKKCKLYCPLLIINDLIQMTQSYLAISFHWSIA